jgi:hypothetical protein
MELTEQQKQLVLAEKKILQAIYLAEKYSKKTTQKINEIVYF